MRRFSSYSTTVLTIEYGRPIFIDMPKRLPSSSCCGSPLASRTVPEPSISRCFAGIDEEGEDRLRRCGDDAFDGLDVLGVSHTRILTAPMTWRRSLAPGAGRAFGYFNSLLVVRPDDHTGQGAWLTTCVLTDPMSARWIAPRPREPTTTTSAAISCGEVAERRARFTHLDPASTVAGVDERRDRPLEGCCRGRVGRGPLGLDLLGGRDAAAEAGLDARGLEDRGLRDAHDGHVSGAARRGRRPGRRGDRVVGTVGADEISQFLVEIWWWCRQSSGSAAISRVAASMSARWVNACGKFPRC